MSPFITLTGQSNKDYVFTVLSLNRKLPTSAGLFVVTDTISDKDRQVHHTPLQIGSCNDLSKEFNPKRIEQLRNEGLKMVCVKIEEVVECRNKIELDLKAKYLS